MRTSQPLAIKPVSLFGDDQHRLEFIRFDVIERNPHSEPHSGHQIQSAPDEQALLGRLGGIKLVQWAVVTPALTVRGIRA